ncbi:MAG: 2-C-methyl-D-erythritol 2,4-cyclodiphosphate synthase [Synergistetes bacterium]|nr:2-C-methyl-D-erythritol 2,4-cyclodiphosphate synthase [Synergistota bacterium]MCX8127374.1 2-C-methyl-D-erythritol 2,4-cyclodiphosphate synthase [Synergistota bacterium]MDW8192238.1 2-C-methyl-D-erythritol 2,4-cyclodiphosphate synthase [Synergistota bacterium]
MDRIGLGYDIHPLVQGRRLFLGGIEIDYSMGLLGHSDADVVIHSLCDALLGALALGDLGDYFPSGDPTYKDIRSEILLKEVLKIVAEKGYVPYQVDVTIVAEAPRLKSYIPLMREKLSRLLDLDLDNVSIKAVSPEGLGALGRKEGIAAITLVKVVGKK